MVTLALYLLIHLSRWALRSKTVLSDLLLRLTPENLPSPLFSFFSVWRVMRIHVFEMIKFIYILAFFKKKNYLGH